MSLGGKPKLIKTWLMTARKAQVAALLVFLFIMLLAPKLCGILADSLYPPPEQSLGKRIVKVFAPRVSHKHPLRDIRYAQFIQASYWLWLIPLGLLFQHLPLALAQCQRESDRLLALAATTSDTNTKRMLLAQAMTFQVASLANKSIAINKNSWQNTAQSTLVRTSFNAREQKSQTFTAPQQTIGDNERYQLVKALASGGAGVVYQAFDTRLKRQVAIKQLLTHVANDASMVARFQEEAHALANLNHPNIIPIYDLLEAQGQLWMVMELMTGGTLADKIAQEKLELKDALALLNQITDGLATAHQKTIVHRDIKPENILFGADGRPKIGDFGIAKSAAKITKTQQGLVIGSPGYMSPEQAAGQSTDHRSDIYALGVTLYEMLSGELPFAGTTTQVLSKHITQPAPMLSTLRRETPASIDCLLQKMLAKDPEQRHQSVIELQAEINAIQRELGLTG